MKKFTIGIITILTFLLFSKNLSAQVTLTADTTEGCVSFTVNFNVESDGGYYYYFSFGTYYSNTVSHTYDYAGEYTVDVEVYDINYNYLEQIQL